MFVPACTLPFLLALLQIGEAAARSAEGWSSLPMPALAVAPPATAATPRLLKGEHLLLPAEDLTLESPTPAAALPAAALLELVQEEASRRKLALRLHPLAPPLLARGERAALDSARALLEDLDRQSQQLEIEVSAWLTPGAARVGTHPSPQVLEAAAAAAAPLGRARVRSGATAVLGSRSLQGFVAGYTVEIASGSAVAGPALGRIVSGQSLHVRASRVRAGRGIALEGFLDLSELLGMEEFDPDTADLGLLQQPRVGAVQVAFAGLVAPGGALCVTIEGVPLAQPDWTLWLVARTPPTPEAPPATWRAHDLSFLSQAVSDLPLPRPGFDFEELESGGGELSTLLYPLSPAELAQAADAARASSGHGGRTPVVWGGGLVLAPVGEAALWSEIESLVAAAEGERLVESSLQVVQGSMRVQLPVLAGRPARVLAVEERSVVGGYDLQVAQDTWLPHPIVSRVLDGLLVQGRAVHGRFEGTAWRTTSTPTGELSRKQTHLARLPLGQRSLSAAALRVSAADSLPALPAAQGTAELRLALEPRP